MRGWQGRKSRRLGRTRVRQTLLGMEGPLGTHSSHGRRLQETGQDQVSQYASSEQEGAHDPTTTE